MFDQTNVSDSVIDSLFLQDYTPATKLEGVQILPVKCFPADEGDFSELLRLNESGELENVPGFKPRQINRTTLFSGSIKGWHMHYKQDELWYVAPHAHIVVGLWDLRKGSSTENQSMKIILGSGQSKMLHIPHGVAHGLVNHSPVSIDLFYFVNQQFNLEDPDEQRLHWNARGAEFWSPERD